MGRKSIFCLRKEHEITNNMTPNPSKNLKKAFLKGTAKNEYIHDSLQHLCCPPFYSNTQKPEE